MTTEVLRIRKKPYELTAMQFLGGKENGEDIQRWLHEYGAASSWMSESPKYKATDGKEGWPEKFYIRTTHGTTQVSLGDWVVHEVDGEFKSCPPEAFYAKYDRVDTAEETFQEALRLMGQKA